MLSLAFFEGLPYDPVMDNAGMKLDLKRTVLYECHVAAEARMGPSGGYLMPIQYEGIVREHHSSRKFATIFDTCHMGEFRIEGEEAVSDLERLLTCHIASLETGQCRYGLIFDACGGVIDNLLVYRLAEKAFMLVVNAATQDDDFAWIENHLLPTTRQKICRQRPPGSISRRPTVPRSCRSSWLVRSTP